MLKHILIFLIFGSLLSLNVLAQESPTLTSFTPRESRITLDYPSNWIVREERRIIALADSESSLGFSITDSLQAGQFKILIAHLTAPQREEADITGTNIDAILQSVIANSNVPLSTNEPKRYEFNRRLTVRSDFVNEGNNEGAVWVMDMGDGAVVLLQVFTAPNEFAQIEGQIIELLRSVDFSDIVKQLYAIPTLDRPLQFRGQQTRLVFDYPAGWTVTEPTENTVLLSLDSTQISLQLGDYTDLSLQGIPIDDPSSILQSQQARSSRPQTFGDVRQVTVNGITFPYSRINGEGFTGLSLGRDIKVGFLWVTVLTAGETLPEETGALAWSLLLTTTYRVDVVELTERVIVPQHQFEFFHPADWLIREVSPSSYLLGTSERMIDAEPDSLQFTDEAQLLIQYVAPSEYSVARAGTSNTLEVLQKFVATTSSLTTYDTPRRITLGNFEFAQVDFDNPNYSGTALLTPMSDGGAVWMQLRTPPNELGDWEPIALAIARQARIVRADNSGQSTLDDAIFSALGTEPTPIPTATRSDDTPPDLGDVIQGIVATPLPTSIRQLTFERPATNSVYTTNISKLSVNYPDGWLVQETFPLNDEERLFENGIRLANDPNLLLTNVIEIDEGSAEVIVQYMPYNEMDALGFRGDTLFERIQKLVNTFPQSTFDTPQQFFINGDLMILVTSSTPTRQSLTIYRELSDLGYVSVQLAVNPQELNLWLPTAVAISQSAQVE